MFKSAAAIGIAALLLLYIGVMIWLNRLEARNRPRCRWRHEKRCRITGKSTPGQCDICRLKKD